MSPSGAIGKIIAMTLAHKINDEQMTLLFVRYDLGATMVEIAEDVYLHFGFASANSCEVSIVYGFKRLGFRVRNAHQTRQLRNLLKENSILDLARNGKYVFAPETRRWLQMRIDQERRDLVARAREIDVLNDAEIVKRYPAETHALARNAAKAKMSPAQVEAAFRSHQDGLSVSEIAASIWQHYGYISKEKCESSLRQRFISLGLLGYADAQAA